MAPSIVNKEMRLIQLAVACDNFHFIQDFNYMVFELKSERLAVGD